MPYCKYCGMNSRNSASCEWCGRELAQTVQISTDSAKTTRRTSTSDDAWAETVLDFFVYWIALILIGSSLIDWHYDSPYILITIASLVVSGFLLTQFETIPAFENAWDEIGVPLMLMLVVFFPAQLVFIGYVVYGLLTHHTERTVIWLMSPQFVILLALIVLTAVTGPDTVPLRMYREFRGLEFLSLSAILLGWSAGSWRRLLNW